MKIADYKVVKLPAVTKGMNSHKSSYGGHPCSHRAFYADNNGYKGDYYKGRRKDDYTGVDYDCI